MRAYKRMCTYVVYIICRTFLHWSFINFKLYLALLISFCFVKYDDSK